MTTYISAKRINFVALGIITFLCSLTIFFWYRTGTILYFDDDWFPFNPALNVYRYSFVWQENAGGAAGGGIESYLISLWYFAMSHVFHVPLWASQGVLFFSLMLIGSFSTFKISQYLINDNSSIMFPLLASFFFLYNIYQMSETWNNNIQTLPFLTGFYPLFVWSLLRTMTSSTGKYKYALITALALYFSMFGGLKTWVTLTAYTVVIAFWILLQHSPSFRHGYRYVILVVLTFLVLFLPLLISVSFIYVSFYGNPSAASQAINCCFEIRNRYGTILNTFHLWGDVNLYSPTVAFPNIQSWFSGLDDFLKTWSFNWFTMFIPFLIVSVSMLYKNKHRRIYGNYLFLYVLFLALFTQISILNGPLRSLFMSLLERFPFLAIYDEPWDSSGFFFIFTLSLLIPLSFKLLSTSRLQYNKRTVVSISLILLLVIYLAPQAYMFITGGFMPQDTHGIYNQKQVLPPNVISVASYLNSQPYIGNTLVFPSVEGRVIYDWPVHIYGTNIFVWMLSNDPIVDGLAFTSLEPPQSAQIQQFLLKFTDVHAFNNPPYLPVIDTSVKGYIIQRKLDLSAPGNYVPVQVKEGGNYTITFYGNPVGQVSVLLSSDLSGRGAYHTASSSSTELSLTYSVTPNEYIIPIISPSSNVTYVKVERTGGSGPIVDLTQFYPALLKLLGVRWVVTDNVYRLWLNDQPINRTFYESIISPYAIDERHFDSTTVFRLRDALPLVYVPQRIYYTNFSDPSEFMASVVTAFNSNSTYLLLENNYAINSSIRFPLDANISFVRVNPTYYAINLTNHQDSGIMLVLNMDYDPNWQAVVRQGNDETYIPKEYHFVANGFANGWYLPIHKGSFTITLIYTPQKIYSLMLQLSAASIAAVVSSLILMASLEMFTKRLNVPESQAKAALF